MNSVKRSLVMSVFSVCAGSALAIDTPDWGNPYDLYIGGVTYNGSGYTGHSGMHGSVVSGGTMGICNSRLQDKKSMHQSAGDSFVSQVNCYLKTTVLHEPQIVSPDLGGGNTGTTPIHVELDALEEKYDLQGYQQELNAIQKRYNISGFRQEFEQLYIRSLQSSSPDDSSSQEDSAKESTAERR